MKSIVILIATLLSAFCASAQQNCPADDIEAQQKIDDRLIQVNVPSKMAIKDCIFLRNNSKYYIIQMAVAIEHDPGDYEVIGQASYVPVGKTVKIANFDDNGLKKLRGKNLVVKIKGAKVDKQNVGGNIDINASWDNVGTQNGYNIDQVTYEFNVRLSEKDHDLYITAESNGALDF